MLAVGGDPEPPLDGRGSALRAEVRRHPRDRRAGVRPVADRRGCGRATATRSPSSSRTSSAALEDWGRDLSGTIVLDGEVVALDEAGTPQGFQRLQHRIHVSVPGYRSKKAILPPDEQPAALVVFDLLHRQRARPPRAAAHGSTGGARARARGAPVPLLDAAHQRAGGRRWPGAPRAREGAGVGGLLVKQARSPYRTGTRSPEWRKLKLQHVDEFVVCGCTEPQGARARFGALILGARTGDNAKNGTLSYVGDVGTGFNGAELDRLWGMLQRLATKASPFADTPVDAGQARALGDADAGGAGPLYGDHRRGSPAASGVPGPPRRQDGGRGRRAGGTRFASTGKAVQPRCTCARTATEGRQRVERGESRHRLRGRAPRRPRPERPRPTPNESRNHDEVPRRSPSTRARRQRCSISSSPSNNRRRMAG